MNKQFSYFSRLLTSSLDEPESTARLLGGGRMNFICLKLE
jgi:hypothetical protein